MKLIGISGSIVGSKTRIAIEYALNRANEKYPDIDVELINLGDYDLVFCDGRDYRDYTGDTKKIIDKIMAADGFIIGSPVFQSSIPGALKNLFDLLPFDAFQEKVVGIVITAGSSKHYLVAEQQLKPILTYMKAFVFPKYVFIEDHHYHEKQITDPEILKRLNQLTENTILAINAVNEVFKTSETSY
ncbi:NADPH-dependent FMN reductase [Oceanobacillus salinisoli]|uniref:NADPH-dependent FMN reductase n=1 Tax=Oceanobacillus salinisoli TaxID=2678611 RepID=UPI0012E10924|nr:NADPH-dependent FMN reductase [Oceanobacillus salinisoli]